MLAVGEGWVYGKPFSKSRPIIHKNGAGVA